ncbi:MFS transporter [Schumannella soli]|uniref:MFS transporter n=1 Tax=Schumannella soli TaxID=2590779 RepID=A0A506Y6M7_9MICO|nr:MFS transporter [Schumannella soli]TPW77665.1 MFS transporter [Schumannella soli]
MSSTETTVTGAVDAPAGSAASVAAAPAASTSPRRAPRRLRDAWIALAGLAAVFLFEMLDNSILTVALPTIGRELHASTTALQWVTGAYAVVFGGLMLAFGAVADRFGRRRLMVIGLVLLALSSLATAFVQTPAELIAVRLAMGVAAAMTTPGSMALAFRLFGDDALRVRAINVISTVGLVGLAIGPTAGGLVLGVAPWQVLLLVNVPVAVLAIVGILLGVERDRAAELHRDPIDVLGALLGTATITLALVAPTLFVSAFGPVDAAGASASTGHSEHAAHAAASAAAIAPWMPWAATVAALACAALFVVRQRTARHPLLDLSLLAHPLVASGLAFKAAATLATAGLGYLVTLQLQLDYGWPPALAALGLLPQVVVLIAGGAAIRPLMQHLGLDRMAWMSAAAVVAGLAVYALLGHLGYPFIALALVLVAAGMRVAGVVAGTNVMRGLPESRSTIGAALADTAGEVTNGVGIAVVGTILAGIFTGSLTAGHWTAAQTGQFHAAVQLGGGALALTAALLVVAGFVQARRGRAASSSATATATVQ